MVEETRSVVAVELNPVSLKLVEYLPSENRVLAVAMETLEPERWGNSFYLEERLKAFVSRYRRMETSDLVSSVPGLNAIVRIVEIPAGEENILDAIQWDMEQYLARPLDQYAMDYRPLQSGGGLTYLVAAYRRSEVARIQNLFESSIGIRLAALSVDAEALPNHVDPLNAFKDVAVNPDIDMRDLSVQCAGTLELALQYAEGSGINLLKPRQAHLPKNEPLEFTEEREEFSEWLEEAPKSNRTWVVILSMLVLVGAGVYFAVRHRGRPQEKMDILRGPQPVASSPISAPTATPAAAPEPVATKTDTPSMPDTSFGARAERIFPGYSKLSPSKLIAFQQSSGAQLLHDLLAAAPEGVGFSRIAFTPPGEFYIHGVATTAADMQHFQKGFNTLPGLELQENKIQSVGADQHEFVFSGRVAYSGMEIDSSKNRVLAANQSDASLQRFLKTAKAQNIDMDPPQLRDSSNVDGVRHRVYHTEARCDYVKLQALLEALRKARSNVGFQQLALEARGEESMTASLDLILYSK